MRIRLSYVILLAAIALSAAFDVLFYGFGPEGVNMLLAEILFLGFSLTLAKSQDLNVPSTAKIAGGFALAFSAAFAIWTSPWSLVPCFLGFLVANVLFVIFILGESAYFRHPLDVAFSMLLAPARHVLGALPFARTLVPEKLSARNTTILKACGIALPILLIFGAIFAAADPIFRSYIDDFFTWLEQWLAIEKIVSHGFFIAFYATLFGLFFAAAFWQRKGKTIHLKVSTEARAVLESKIILGSVVLLFAIFLIISGAPLFGGSSALAALDITYADYARQGFGQLSAAAALVVGLIMTLRVLHSENVDRQLTVLQTVLLSEAVLVLLSAFLRLGLYIGSYGYTPARLFGMWFFSLVGLLLMLTLVNVLRRKQQTALMTQMLVASGVAVLCFAIMSPDALSVRLNHERAKPMGEEFPLADSLRLSEEAIPAIIDAVHADVGVEDSSSALRRYSDKIEALQKVPTDPWQIWNYSRWRAHRAALDLIPDSE